MKRYIQYLCGCALVTGILLFPTSSADSSDEPAQQYETVVTRPAPERPPVQPVKETPRP